MSTGGKIILTDLQKRFVEFYECLISRANVYPLIPNLTREHDLVVIPNGSQYDLKGFYIKPRFAGEIELKIHSEFLDLFDETGLKVTAEEIGLIVSWNAFNRAIASARKANDEAHDHVFKYLLGQLNLVIAQHPKERLIGLAYQTLDYQADSTLMSSNQKAAQLRATFKIVS